MLRLFRCLSLALDLADVTTNTAQHVARRGHATPDSNTGNRPRDRVSKYVHYFSLGGFGEQIVKRVDVAYLSELLGCAVRKLSTGLNYIVGTGLTMLIRIACSRKTLMKSLAVNWLP